MKLCVVTIKDTWQDAAGRWMTDGGFPAQMSAISALFDETTLVLVRVPPRAGGIPLPPRARVVPLPLPGGQDLLRKLAVIARLPHYLWIIAREVRRADVVHTPLPGDIGILGMLTAQLFRKPLVARYCGSWVTNSQTTRMNRIVRGWMRATAGGHNVMLATGAGDQPPAARMHWVFATAVSQREIDDIRPDLTRPRGVPARLVFIGRLSSEKGLSLLLDAIAALRARGLMPVPHLTLIGQGAERAALERHARALDLPVVFTGQLDRAALSRHLLEADLCVQPSLSEGFSKAWLDAMSHGVPLIASDVGAAREVIGAPGERGWVVAPGDAADLAARLEEAVTAEIDWPALRRRCRAFAEARTIEAWGAGIGAICARQWGVRMLNGRLA